MIAKELEGIASFDERQALVDQRLQIAGLDLRAVLLGLAVPLGLFVVVKCALDAFDLAMEQVDDRPQQIGEVVLEAGIGQHRAERIEYRTKLGLGDIRVGQRPRIAFLLAGLVAVERELIEQMRGRGCRVMLVGRGLAGKQDGVGAHDEALLPDGRADRGLHGRSPAGGGAGMHHRLERSGGWRRAAILPRDAKPVLPVVEGPAAENNRPAPLHAGAAPADRPLGKAVGGSPQGRSGIVERRRRSDPGNSVTPASHSLAPRWYVIRKTAPGRWDATARRCG